MRVVLELYTRRVALTPFTKTTVNVNDMKKFWYRLVYSFKCLFKYRGFIIIPVDFKIVSDILSEKETELDIDMVGCREYVALKIIQRIAENYDADDMALEKAAFEGAAELWMRKKYKNSPVKESDNEKP